MDYLADNGQLAFHIQIATEGDIASGFLTVP
jgi:hypothetical protein